jgi:hypothetical protein
MARSVNPKCLSCASLSAYEAQQVHGIKGDGCWDAARCKKRRSHYRNRARRNATRRIHYRCQNQENNLLIEPLSIAVPALASVVLIVYSEYPHTASDNMPIHAIGAEFWLGKECKAKLDPILCLGMRGDKVQALLPQILDAFSNQFAAQYNNGKHFSKFSAKVHCHIRDCPGFHPFNADKLH